MSLFAQLFKKLSSRGSFRDYQRLITLHINKANLLHNFSLFKHYAKGHALAPVLKSNAYGHGLIEVANIFDHEDIPFMVVDTYFEAVVLRENSITSPLLIIGYTPTKTITHSHLPHVSYMVGDIDQIQELAGLAKHPFNVHLKINTGMNRQGISVNEIDKALEAFQKNHNMILEGVFSHLADADGEDTSFTLRQIENWNNVLTKIAQKGAMPRYTHLAATTGTPFLDTINSNVVRLGVGLCGYPISPYLHLDLKPALRAESLVSSVKKIAPDEKIGYGLTYTTEKEIAVAVIPVGYNTLIKRELSNNGFVTIREKPCPIIGRVSMNITTVDASDVPDLKRDEKVVVISDNPRDPNSVENIATLSNTLPYVILTALPQHLKRVVS